MANPKLVAIQRRNERDNSKRSGYKIIGLVGQGQFGRVFCALDRATGQLKALKEIDQQRFNTKQFLRELRWLVTLRHPNLVTCEGLEHRQDNRYLVMDYCEGGTLRSLLESGVKISLPQILKIIVDVLLGLEYAHSRGIVHCDIKPENILLEVESDGWLARISDFGIARLQEEIIGSTGIGATGSPAYMAPERFYGKHSYASDLYAVGVLLYEMVVGVRPFTGVLGELSAAHISQPLQLPNSVPFILRSTLTIALQKLPQSRFQTATEMLKSVRLAAEVARATDGKAPLMSPTSTCHKVAASYQERQLLSQPVLRLAASEQQMVLGMAKEAEARWYEGGILGGRCRQTWHVSFAQTLEKIQRLSEICLTEKGCWLLTQIRQSTERTFSFYFLPLTTMGLAHTVGVTQSQPELYTLLSIAAEQAQIAADPQGTWLAYGATLNQVSSLPWLQLLRGDPTSKLNAYPGQVLTERLSALVSLNHRYGLAVTRQSEPSLPGCQLLVFSRGGRRVGKFNLPVLIEEVTPNPAFPGQLLALDATNPQIALLIHLYPWKVERFCLGINARWLQPMTYGYVVGNDEGQILLISQFGEMLGSFEVDQPITAMSSFGKAGLVLATWAETEGELLTLNLRRLGIALT